MKVRIPNKQEYDALWLLHDSRLVLTKDGKYLTAVVTDDLEVLVGEQWIPLREAWRDNKISFLLAQVKTK